MASNTFKCKYLTPLHFIGLTLNYEKNLAAKLQTLILGVGYSALADPIAHASLSDAALRLEY